MYGVVRFPNPLYEDSLIVSQLVSSRLENLTTIGIEGGDNKQNHQSPPLFKPEIIVRIVLFLYLLSFHTIDENGGVVVKPDFGHHDGDGDDGDDIDGDVVGDQW